MKTLKLSGPLALILMCSLTSCPDHCQPSSVAYWLYVSFQDASGNDLVKGIALEEWYPSNVPVEEAQFGSVKRDLYTLEIIIPEPCKTNFRPGVIPDDPSPPELNWHKLNNGYYGLSSDFSISVDNCPETKILTYRLKCPYIFGDNETHELVTYWDFPKMRHGEILAKCYRIELNGSVFTQIVYEQYISIATVILEI
jgi:hypothetical protein